MTAYMIVRVHVTDMEQYKQYMALTPALIEQFGGRFLARGGEVLTLEGEEETARMVLVEFPSKAQAQTFYNSPEYQHAISVRAGAATAQFVVIGE